MGSTGPAATNPATRKLWGLIFRSITIPDMVRAQAMLIDRLGIETLFCVVGGSMGGMQALPMDRGVPWAGILGAGGACSTRHSAQNIAFHELGRQAVMAEPDWRGGRYFELGTDPHRGPRRGADGRAYHLFVGRRPASQFGRRMQDRELPSVFVRRGFPGRELSALSGLFVRGTLRRKQLSLPYPARWTISTSRTDRNGVLAEAFRGTQTRFGVVSFTSDWLFPTSEARGWKH